MSASLCSFPECGRPAEAKGLCHAHYRQHQRQRALKPLRLERGVKLPGITITRACADALAVLAENPYAAAREVLEGWARERPKEAPDDRR